MSDDELFVKICGITSEADALLAVSLGASAVGFVFAPSPRQIPVQLAGDIVKRLPTQSSRSGSSATRRPSAWSRPCSRPAWARHSFTGTSRPRRPSGSAPVCPLVIKAFRAGDPTIVRFEEFGADYLLVDGENPGSGQVFDWRLAEGVVDHHRLDRLRWARDPTTWPMPSPTCGRPGSTCRPASSRRRAARTPSGSATSSPTLAGPTPRPGARRARRSMTRQANPTTGGTDERRPHGRARTGRPLRRLRRPLRPRVAHAGVPRPREAQFHDAWADPAFRAELDGLLRDYGGRPTPVTECARLSERLGVEVLLKREDLAHTGSHKLNNVVGQALLTKRMGKARMIAETGAGQHGVAAATAAALFGLECTVFMGEVDTQRQELNVFRMELLGCGGAHGAPRAAGRSRTR